MHEGGYAPTRIYAYGDTSFYKNNAEVQQDLAQTNAKLVAFSITKAQAYGGAIYAAQVPDGAYPNTGFKANETSFSYNSAKADAYSKAYGVVQTGNTSKYYDGNAYAYSDAYAGGGAVHLGKGDAAVIADFGHNYAGATSHALIKPHYLSYSTTAPMVATTRPTLASPKPTPRAAAVPWMSGPVIYT